MLLIAADSDAVEVLKRVRRVIGGSDIAEGEWPWLVHLEGKIPSRFMWGIPIAKTVCYLHEFEVFCKL